MATEINGHRLHLTYLKLTDAIEVLNWLPTVGFTGCLDLQTQLRRMTDQIYAYVQAHATSKH